jgi:hypothetical protein
MGEGALDPKRMYEELLSFYRRHHIQPQKALDRDIAEKVSAGLSWEEAVASLYRETFKAEREFPWEGTAETSLEAALERLKGGEGSMQSVYLVLMLFVVVLTFVAALSGGPERRSRRLDAGFLRRIGFHDGSKPRVDDLGFPGKPGSQGGWRAVEGGG